MPVFTSLISLAHKLVAKMSRSLCYDARKISIATRIANMTIARIVTLSKKVIAKSSFIRFNIGLQQIQSHVMTCTAEPEQPNVMTVVVICRNQAVSDTFHPHLNPPGVSGAFHPPFKPPEHTGTSRPGYRSSSECV